MENAKPTWAVVTTVEEPPALVQAFVAWHLSLGAQQIFVYCDKPDDPVQDMLAHLRQVTVIACDAAHWSRIGRSRPIRHEVRQVRNAQDAYARMDADWLLHSDADEFVWPGVPVADALAAAPDDADCLVVCVAERVHAADDANETVLSGQFRRPFRDQAEEGRRLFGPDYDLTYRGLTGHAQGKVFVRRDRAVKLSIHRPRPLHSDQQIAVARSPVRALELLHFDGLTALFWTYKLARMTYNLTKRDGMPPSPHRRRQADALLAHPQEASELYARLKCLSTDQRALLERHGLLSAPAFDPSDALVTYFQDQRCDLSEIAIDDWLRRNKSHVLSVLHE